MPHSDQDNASQIRSMEEACVDAKLALHKYGASDDGRMLAYYPKVHGNPFQEILYSKGFESGFACFSVDDHANSIPAIGDPPLYIHYHWVHRAFAAANTPQEARLAGQRFLDVVEAQKEAGAQIVWTVHNITSHDGLFPDEEIALRASLGAKADHIHIMNPATRELCARYYVLDSHKTFIVPHPSYRGIYSNYISAEQARLNLGIGREEKVLLLFGSLGPRKGTRQFLSELDDVEARVGGPLRVLVAGKQGPADYMEDIYALAASKPWVQLMIKHIDDHSVQTLFNAADVTLCPYDVGLNSGVAATAATFGCVSVVPDSLVPTMAGVESGVIGFNPQDKGSLVDATVRALEASENPSAKLALLHWADTYQSAAVSRSFFNTLRERS